MLHHKNAYVHESHSKLNFAPIWSLGFTVSSHSSQFVSRPTDKQIEIDMPLWISSIWYEPVVLSTKLTERSVLVQLCHGASL